jgi:hypothetical protein
MNPPLRSLPSSPRHSVPLLRATSDGLWHWLSSRRTCFARSSSFSIRATSERILSPLSPQIIDAGGPENGFEMVATMRREQGAGAGTAVYSMVPFSLRTSHGLRGYVRDVLNPARPANDCALPAYQPSGSPLGAHTYASMRAGYEPPLRFLFVDHGGFGVEIDSAGQEELFPRKQGCFVRRPLAANAGDNAVPGVESVTGR